MPLPATLHAPKFLQLEQLELRALLNQCRDPLSVHLFFLIVSQAEFDTGHLLTNYARLIELCTPPQPERGRRMTPPTLKQVRRALDWLEACDLVRRDAAGNEAQGMLRLYVRKRKKTRTGKPAPSEKEGRVKGRGVDKKTQHPCGFQPGT